MSVSAQIFCVDLCVCWHFVCNGSCSLSHIHFQPPIKAIFSLLTVVSQYSPQIKTVFSPLTVFPRYSPPIKTVSLAHCCSPCLLQLVPKVRIAECSSSPGVLVFLRQWRPVCVVSCCPFTVLCSLCSVAFVCVAILCVMAVALSLYPFSAHMSVST